MCSCNEHLLLVAVAMVMVTSTVTIDTSRISKGDVAGDNHLLVLDEVAMIVTTSTGTCTVVPDTFTVSVPDGPLYAWKDSSIILPCSVSPAFTDSLEVRWHRPHEFKTPVLLYQKQQIQQQPADAQYKGRVRLTGELEKGILSLEMDKVQLEDSGDYVCYVSAKTTYQQARIHLVVKVMGTPPVLSVSDGGSGQVNVTCESEGWSPQPTLTWRNPGGTEIPSKSYHIATDAHGLVSVTSWLLHSSSEWIACSVGLSEDERKESRFLPGTVHQILAERESLKQKSEGLEKSKDPDPEEVVPSDVAVHCSCDANAILSCQLSSEKSAVDMEIRWFKCTECIYRYQNGQEKEGRGYEGRVSLCKEMLENGKIFLELRKINPEDKGTYVCQVIHREYNECAIEIRHAPYAKGSGGLEFIEENKLEMEASAQELGSLECSCSLST
ncbi:butyrophilin-like protein 2 [Sardina pilchardus]|uniref:butyrophilin-like protein 2 n=1 Tax=Sardina pilchardus TaxID=27697 RepID=UPI002E151E8C